MVKQCETERSATPSFAEAAQCRLKDEFGNSLLSPVSSLETNMIYINKACADCNKLDTSKLEQWNYLYISSFDRIERDLTFEIEQYAKNRLGKVIYEPPVDQDWSHKRCYYNFLEIKSCQNNRHLLEVCRNLRLPFQHILQNIYRNGICLLCSKKQIDSINPVCSFETFKVFFSSSFSLLVDSSVIKLSKLNSNTLKDNQMFETICSTGIEVITLNIFHYYNTNENLLSFK
jgi:hypothetical protein